MKRLMLSMMSLLLLAFAAMVTSSCDTDTDDYNGYYYNQPTAIVTVRPATATNSQFYLQVDDSTSLLPINMKTSPYGEKEVRAYVNYKYTNDNALSHNKAIQVNWIDSILTKKMVTDMGDNNAKVYGNDPVDIVKSFETCAEDGYMTIRFRTMWGNKASHSVNLSWTKDKDGNLIATFHHNANGDTSMKTADGVVAFRLDDEFNKPDKPYNITLKWKSFDGDKSATFKYIPRKY